MAVDCASFQLWIVISVDGSYTFSSDADSQIGPVCMPGSVSWELDKAECSLPRAFDGSTEVITFGLVESAPDSIVGIKMSVLNA